MRLGWDATKASHPLCQQRGCADHVECKDHDKDQLMIMDSLYCLLISDTILSNLFRFSTEKNNDSRHGLPSSLVRPML